MTEKIVAEAAMKQERAVIDAANVLSEAAAYPGLLHWLRQQRGDGADLADSIEEAVKARKAADQDVLSSIARAAQQ